MTILRHWMGYWNRREPIGTSSSTSRPLKGARYLALGIASIRCAQVLLLVVVLQEVEPANFGEFSMASAIVALALYCAEGGLIQATTSAGALSSQVESAAATYAALTGTAFYGVAVAAAFAVSQVSRMPMLVSYVEVLGSSIVPSAIAAVSIGRMQRQALYRRLATKQSIVGVVSILVCLVPLALGFGVWALIIQSWTVATVFSAWVITDVNTRIIPNWRLREASSIRRTASFALTANIFGVVGRRADDVLVGTILGAAALGQYSVGYRALTTVTEIVLHPAERVALSRMGTERLSQPAEALRYSGQAQRRLAVIAMPLFIGIGGLLYIVVPLALGPEWSQAALCSLVLCAAGAVQSTYWLTYSTLYALASPRKSLAYQIISVIILLGFTASGLSWGVIGCATGYATGTLVCLAVAMQMKARWLRSDEPAMITSAST